MLPVQDVIPSRTTPWITLALIVTMLVLVIVEGLLSEPAVRTLILSYGLVPAHVSWPTAISSLFLHHGLADAAPNLLALWIFGDNVEGRLGHVRFLVFFLLCGVCAGLTMVWLDATVSTPLIGAYGAVGGVVGAYLLLLPSSRVLILVPIWRGVDLAEVPAIIVAAIWLVAGNLVTSAHPGPMGGIPLTLSVQFAGLLIGAAAARLFQRSERRRCEWWNVPAVQPPPVRRRTSRDTSANSVSSASN